MRLLGRSEERERRLFESMTPVGGCVSFPGFPGFGLGFGVFVGRLGGPRTTAPAELTSLRRRAKVFKAREIGKSEVLLVHCFSMRRHRIKMPDLGEVMDVPKERRGGLCTNCEF